MKLLLLFFLISCSKQIDSSFIEKGNPTQTKQYLQENLKGDIDLFVAFFWPENIREDESEIVKEIIEDSLKISKNKNSYFERKKKISCEYKIKSCDCLLYQICDDGDAPNENNFEKCELAEENLQNIENDLVQIAELIDSLRNRLNHFQDPGKWLKTHLDYTSLYRPYINLKEKIFTIPILGHEEISYSTLKGEIYNFNYNDPTLILTINEKKIINGKQIFSGDLIEAKIDILNQKHVYQFMGELKKEKNGKTQRGILYFELPKSEQNCIN